MATELLAAELMTATDPDHIRSLVQAASMSPDEAYVPGLERVLSLAPERKADVEQLQKEMSYHMLATFGAQFRKGPSPEEMQQILKEHGAERSEDAEWQGVKLGQASPEELEEALGGTILKEFKLRLERIGVEYQTPIRP